MSSIADYHPAPFEANTCGRGSILLTFKGDMKRRHGHTPKYSLERIQQLVAIGRIRITDSAEQGAELLVLEQPDIIECICRLGDDDYEQSLESTHVPGTYQDVYKPRYMGRAIYLKLRLIGDHDVILISFKQDTSR